MDLTFVVVAAAIYSFGLVSGRLERSPLTAPLFFTAAGWGLGRLGVLGADVGEEAIHTLAELTLILVLFTDASRIDLGCLRRERALPTRLLAIGMPLTIVAGTAVGKALFPALTWVEAGLLAAILTPTDAALGQAVVSNPAVPVRIRQSLNAESGLNDGIALPVVLLLASMAGAVEEGEGAAFWVRFVVLAVTLGPLAGAAVGWVGGKLLAAASARDWVNEPFQRLSVLALAFGAFGAAELVGGNGFIAAFVAGLCVGNAAPALREPLQAFGEAEGQLLALAVFGVFGATLLPAAVAHTTATAVVYAVLSLTVVRMVPVALCLLGSGLRGP
ncbi:MAG: cation:proton antiporter, partial [Myxococcales bacterium]|nr:cation:proton antiporter [Myxococcales bacterium]